MQFVSLIPVSRIFDELCIISDLVPAREGYLRISVSFTVFLGIIGIIGIYCGTKKAILLVELVCVLDSYPQALCWTVTPFICGGGKMCTTTTVVCSTYCLLSIERDNKIVGQLIRSLQLSLKQVATSHNLLCVLKKYRSGSGGMA